MGYCIKCGELLDDDAKFCMGCGTPVQDKALANQITLSNISKNYVGNNVKKVKNGDVITAIALIVIIGFIIGTAIYLSTGYICDWCGEQCYGTSYYDCFEPELTYCEDCAKEYYTFGGYQNYKN